MQLNPSLVTTLYQPTVDRVDNIMSANSEWIRRYHDYIDDLNIRISPLINAANLRFGTAKNFDIYLPLSMAEEATKSSAHFDIRVGGQSVATLYVQKDEVNIRFRTEHNVNYFKDYDNFPCIVKKSGISTQATLGSIPEKEKISWHSHEAVAFRKFFSQYQVANLKSPEHTFESQLLKQFAMTTSVGKLLRNIQPVKLLGKRFQMPTPLQASEARKGSVNYASASGGGVDILARHGTGRNTSLTVFELKDECDKKEKPGEAIAQAIAYATFIRQLLRSSDTNADKWWSFFGFGRPLTSSDLGIKAVIAMPAGDFNDTSFAGIKLQLLKMAPYNDDHIELHYMYFNVNNSKEITGISSTSL